MEQQIIINILYFLLHDVFQWLSCFVILTLMLTPKYNRALIILIPFAIAFFKPVHDLPDNKFVLLFILFGFLILTALTAFKEKKRICLAAVAASQLVLAALNVVCTAAAYDILGYCPTEVQPYTWDAIIYIFAIDYILWLSYMAMLSVWNRLLKRKSEKSLGYFWLFPVGQILFLWGCIFRARLDMERHMTTNPYIKIAIVVSVVSAVLMYMAIKENTRLQEMKQSLGELENKMKLQLKYYEVLAELENETKLQLKYYEALAQQYTEIREYRHDIRNLIASVKAMAWDEKSVEQRRKLINEMEQKADEMSVSIYCPNSLVNAVLWQKSKEAKSRNVEFTVCIEPDEKFGMELIDTCSLLVNILDNAIDEAAKTPRGEVVIKIVRRAGALFIDASNNTDKIIDSAERLASAKIGDHGHGMVIIEKIVKKYNGSVVFSADGESAHTVVSLFD